MTEIRAWPIEAEASVDMSASEVLAHVRNPGNWPELLLHPIAKDLPRLDLEFHGRAGYSVLCFDNTRSIGRLACSKQRLSLPSVLVCLGGQVIEKWPREFFLETAIAEEVVSHFLASGRRTHTLAWIRVDRFSRETIHPGGKGLIPLWQKLREEPAFPFGS